MRNARLILASISALCVFSTGVAHASEQAAPRTISDITELLKQYQPNPKLVEENRAKAGAEPPAGLSGAALAQFLSDRGYAAAEIGDAKGAIADLRKAVEITRSTDFSHLRSLANFLYAGGNNIEMLRMNENLLASNASPVGKISYAGSIAQFYWQTGNRDGGRAALRQMEDAYARVARSNQTDRFVFRVRGKALMMDGNWDEAETALRRAADAAKAYSDNPGGATPGFSAAAVQANAFSVHNNTDVDLASFLTDRNRLDEAELILRSVLKRVLARQGPYHVRSGITMQAFAELLTAQGRYQEATIMARAAVGSYETGGAVPEARGLADSRRTLASSLVLESRWSEALAVFEQMRNGLAADPGSQALYARGDATGGWRC